MSKKIIGLLAAMFICGTASTQAQQTTTAVNTGNGKAVKRITFDREQVTIAYADGTQDEGVQQATIHRSGASGIRSLTPNSSPKGEGTYCYTLDGRRIKNARLTKGVYIVKEDNRVRKIVKK